MEKYNLKDFMGGWIVGDFSPALFNNKDVEISIKRYKAGIKEDVHFHKISTEYTIIVSGKVTINGIEYNENDIIEIKPNEVAEFITLTDTITCVVKTPSSINDKYIVTQ